MRSREARTPATSARALTSAARRSYQAGITKPWLIVTGIVGACGNRKRTASDFGSASSGTRRRPAVAGVAQAVQPDHRRVGVRSGVDDDRGKEGSVHGGGFYRAPVSASRNSLLRPAGGYSS
jgi:hypothetical protein